MIIDKDGNHIDPKTGVVVIATTTLGQVIRKKRLKWGFAQRDLAMMVRGERMPFCSPQTLNNIEHDDRLGQQYWASISERLKIPMEVFIYYGILVPINMFPSYEYPYEVIQEAFKAMESVLDKHLAERKKQDILPVSEESVVEKTQTSDD